MAGYIGSKVAVVSSGAERKKVFTATSGQTSFTGLSYTVNNVHVFQNGVRLVDGTDYTATNGNSITLTVGAATDDQVVVVSYNTFQTSDTVSASTGGTFAGDVNFTGAFTSQGIDDNATSTAMTLDGSGNLLVGQSSTALPGDGNTTTGISISGQYDLIAASRSSGATLKLNRNSDGDIATFSKDGTTVGVLGSISGDILTIGSGTSGFAIIGEAADAYPARIIPRQADGTSSDGLIDLGDSGARFKDLYLSGGVVFDAVAGNATSNTLDDYEEGTWTPIFADASSGGNTDEPSVKRGQYTKIGQQVTITLSAGNLRTVGMTATNDFYIRGLPFTPISQSSPNQVYSGVVRCSSITFSGFLTAYLLDNQTYFRILEIISGASSDAVRVTEVEDNVADLDVTITYFTDD